MTNQFKFNFTLSVFQIISLSKDILFAHTGISIISDERNILQFSYEDKVYTLVVNSANSITLAYYNEKADFGGAETYQSIEECFTDLNRILKLVVETRNEIVTIPARESNMVTKQWILPTEKVVDMSSLTTNSPIQAAKTKAEKISDEDRLFSFDEPTRKVSKDFPPSNHLDYPGLRDTYDR